MDWRTFAAQVTIGVAIYGLFFIVARLLLRRVPQARKQAFIERQNGWVWFIGALIIGIAIGGAIGAVLEQVFSVSHEIAGLFVVPFGIAALMFFGLDLWRYIRRGRL